MLFYMQMRNWMLIFLMLTLAYMIQQKSSGSNVLKNYALKPSANLTSIIR